MVTIPGFEAFITSGVQTRNGDKDNANEGRNKRIRTKFGITLKSKEFLPKLETALDDR